MTQPRLIVELSFTPTPAYPPDWVDVSDLLVDTVDIRRGSNDEFDMTATGTATIVLLNQDRRFDPENEDSPYWPLVRPMQRIRVSAQQIPGESARPLYTGFIQSYTPARPYFGLRTVRITAIDSLGAALAQNDIPESIEIVNAPFTETNYDTLTGETFTSVGPIVPFTTFHLRNGFGVTNNIGQYRIKYNGDSTPWLDASATCAQVANALAGLFDSEITVYPFVDKTINSPLLVGSTIGAIFVIAGDRYRSVDLSADITIEAELERSYFFTPAAPATDSVPSPLLTNIFSRALELELKPVSGGFVMYYHAYVIGLNYDNAIDYEQFTWLPGSELIRTTTKDYKQIYNILIERARDPQDVGSVLSVRMYTDSIPAGNFSGEAFAKIATLAGLRLSDLNYDRGVSLLDEIDPIGKKASAILKEIASSEGGALFVASDGRLTFRSRIAVVGEDSIATFDDIGEEDGRFPYEELTTTYDERYIKNSVSIAAAQGDPQLKQNAESIERYFLRSHSENLLVLTDDAARGRAQYLAAMYGEPKMRVERIDLRGDLDPTLWAIVLGAELTQGYSVVTDSGAVKDVTLIGINIRIQRGDWSVSWTLAPRPNVFRADISLAGGPDIVMY